MFPWVFFRNLESMLSTSSLNWLGLVQQPSTWACTNVPSVTSWCHGPTPPPSGDNAAISSHASQEDACSLGEPTQNDDSLSFFFSSVNFPHLPTWGLPRWLNDRESTCQHRSLRFNPWVGKISWSRKWQPTPVFLPRKSHGQRTAAVHRVTELGRIEHVCTRAHTHTHTHTPLPITLLYLIHIPGSLPSRRQIWDLLVGKLTQWTKVVPASLWLHLRGQPSPPAPQLPSHVSAWNSPAHTSPQAQVPFSSKSQLNILLQ